MDEEDGDKRRICIVTFFYAPAGGGVPRYVESLSKILSELGHKVDIITASYNGKSIERQGNITIYRVPFMTIAQDPKINRENSRKFLKFLKKYVKKRPNIFVSQSFHTVIRIIGHPLALNMVSQEKNIPLIETVHAFIKEDEYSSLKHSLLKDLLWDKLVIVGQKLAESLFKEGVPSELITSVLPPVDTNQFKPDLGKKWLRSRVDVSEKDFLILHASRVETENIADEKGIFTTLKALTQIKDKKVKLLIATAPTAPIFQERKEETINKIEERIKILGLKGRVIIKTFLPEEMPLVYNGADLFVLASKYENCSLSVSEAMACEIPVIATNIGGLPDIIEAGKTGEMINPEDYVEMANKIKQLIKSPVKRKKIGHEARTSVIERQEINKICKHLLGIYESAILKRNPKDNTLQKKNNKKQPNKIQ